MVIKKGIKMKKIIILFILFLTTIVYAEKSKIGVSSNTEGAYIYVDDKKIATIGIGYTSLLLEEGNHTIKVEKTSKNKDWLYSGKKTIFVSDDTSFNIHIQTRKTASEYRLNRLKKAKKSKKIILSKKTKAKTYKRKSTKPKVFFRAYGLSIIKTRGDFIRSLNGVIVDTKRKLFWQDSKDVIDRKHAWAEANEYCNSFVLSGISNWRLPSKKELNTLYHAKRNKIFEHEVSGYIWTSDSIEKDKMVYDTYGLSKPNILYTRCVSNK